MHKEDVSVLLEKLKNGDETAFESLVAQYRPLLLSVASSFDATAKEKKLGSVFVDLSQELTLALYRAAVNFDPSRGRTTFGNYARRCLTNCAISFIRKSESAKRREVRARESLEKKDGSSYLFPDFPQIDPASVVEASKEVLSPYEYAVFSKYAEGCSVAEIARETGRSAKSVSNAVFRCKTKVREAIKKGK